MRLVRMSYLELKPAAPEDYPRISLKTGRAIVDWLGRWPTYDDKDHSTKIHSGVPYWQALPVYAFRDQAQDEEAKKWALHLGLERVEDLIDELRDRSEPSGDREAAMRPRTPIWLSSPPPPKPERPPFEGEDGDGPYIFVLSPSRVVEILSASTELEQWPERDYNNRIHLPEDALKETLRAVEVFADLLSISHPSSRSLTSPRFPVGLQSENAEEEAWLNASAGIAKLSEVDVDVEQGNHQFHLLSLPADTLADRLDGVKMLADVFSQLWPTGRFRELWRFFERAFRLPSGRIVVPLGDFLASGGGSNYSGYSRREVGEWVRLRGPAVHGDRRDTFVLAADVEPILDRMEFAAKDVLLHKNSWGDSSSTRRVLALDRTLLPKGHPAFEETQSPGNSIYSVELRVKAIPALGSGPLNWSPPPWTPGIPGVWMKPAASEGGSSMST
jgi:hypothetical protein